MENEQYREEVLKSVSLSIVDSLNFQFNTKSKNLESTDKVKSYDMQLLSLGCFYLEFSDAIREGDGDRVLRCWRYMLPMFINARRKNYAIESLNFLVQHDVTLPPRQAAELIWSRFINVHGLPGRNIPNDLHMEHLNRIVKNSIKGLGANKTEAAITKIGRALGVVAPILENFDETNNVTTLSGTHKMPNAERDMRMMVEEILPFFSQVSGRTHMTFPNPNDPLHYKSRQELVTWILEHIKL